MIRLTCILPRLVPARPRRARLVLARAAACRPASPPSLAMARVAPVCLTNDQPINKQTANKHSCMLSGLAAESRRSRNREEKVRLLGRPGLDKTISNALENGCLLCRTFKFGILLQGWVLKYLSNPYPGQHPKRCLPLRRKADLRCRSAEQPKIAVLDVSLRGHKLSR